MNFNFAQLILVFTLNFCLAFFTISNNYKNNINKFFALFIGSVNLWMISLYFSNNYNQWAMLWTRFTFFGAILLACFLSYFSLYFPSLKSRISRKVHLFLIFPTALVAFMLFFTNKIVAGITVIPTGTGVSWGSWYLIWPAYFVSLILFSLVNLISKYKTSEKKARNQIRLIFVGLALSLSFAMTTNMLIPLIFKSNSLSNAGPYSTLIFIAFAFYAIVKHQLFNIKVVLTEIAVGIIGIASLVQALMAKDASSKLISWVILIIVIYGSYILIKSVLHEIKQREEMESLAKEREKALKEVDERNRNLLTLQKFSNIVLDNIELTPMIQGIIDIVPREISNCFGALVSLVDKDENAMRGLSISHVPAAADIMSLLKKDIDKFSQPLEDKHDLLMQTFHSQSVQRSNNLADFLVPPLDRSTVQKIQHISDIKGVISFPLSAGEEHFGVLLYGMKVPVEKVGTDDLSMMIAIAGQVSLAVQRALAYENLKKANEYLKQLDQMKDEFISVASHEMNTPLAAIEGYLSMILEEHMGKVDATAQEYLNRVYSSSKRLAALILDLLNVSRIEQGRIHLMYGQTTPQELVKSVIDELTVKADAKKLYIKYEKPDEELPSTWVDINRLREVLVNLVGNSIKFTEKGGVTIYCKKDGKMLEFMTHDTGIGITAENVDKLFKKFSQLDREKNEFQGSGLGLYISKSLVELHGGKMWVEATPEGQTGATFKFTIPILKEKPIDEHEGEGAVIHASASSEVEKEVKEVAAEAK